MSAGALHDNRKLASLSDVQREDVEAAGGASRRAHHQRDSAAVDPVADPGSPEHFTPVATDVEGRALPWSLFFDAKRERATRPPEVRFAVEPALLSFYREIVEGTYERELDARMKRCIVRRVERAKRVARKQAREAAEAGIFHGDAIHRRVVTQFRVHLRRSITFDSVEREALHKLRSHLREEHLMRQSARARGGTRTSSNQTGGEGGGDGGGDGVGRDSTASQEELLWQQKRVVTRKQQRQQLEGSAQSLKQRQMLHRLEAIEEGSAGSRPGASTSRRSGRTDSVLGSASRRGRRPDAPRGPRGGPGSGRGARATGAQLVSRLAAESFTGLEAKASLAHWGRDGDSAAEGEHAGGTAPARIAAFRESLRRRALGRSEVCARPKGPREAPLLGANRTAEEERPWRSTAAAMSPYRGASSPPGSPPALEGETDDRADKQPPAHEEGRPLSPPGTQQAFSEAASTGEGTQGGAHSTSAEEVGGAMLARRRRPQPQAAGSGGKAPTPALATSFPREQRSLADRIKVRAAPRLAEAEEQGSLQDSTARAFAHSHVLRPRPPPVTSQCAWHQLEMPAPAVMDAVQALNAGRMDEFASLLEEGVRLLLALEEVARSVEANGLSAGRVQQLLEGATAEVLREQRLFLDWGVDAPRVDIVKTLVAHAKSLGASVSALAERMAADFNGALSYRGNDAAAIVGEHHRAEERFAAWQDRELQRAAQSLGASSVDEARYLLRRRGSDESSVGAASGADSRWASPSNASEGGEVIEEFQAVDKRIFVPPETLYQANLYLKRCGTLLTRPLAREDPSGGDGLPS